MLKLTSAERIISFLFLVLVVLAGLALAIPGLVIFLTIIIIGMPLAIAINFAPTVLMYVGPAMVAFLFLRLIRVPRVAASIVGLAISGIAIYLAMDLVAEKNAPLLDKQKGYLAGDIPGPVKVSPIDTLIYLEADRTDGGEPYLKCSSECQRALFSGFATQFAMGYSDDFDPGSPQQKVFVVHEIVPFDGTCNNDFLSGSRGEEGDFGYVSDPTRMRLWDVLQKMDSQDLCFRSRMVDTISGDAVMVRERNGPGNLDEDWNWRFGHVAYSSRAELYLREGDKLNRVMRESFMRVALLAKPLMVTLPFNFNTHNPGGWTTIDTPPISPSTMPAGLDEFFDADLSVDIDKQWRVAPKSAPES